MQLPLSSSERLINSAAELFLHRVVEFKQIKSRLLIGGLHLHLASRGP
jgi:hypothetical protein